LDPCSQIGRNIESESEGCIDYIEYYHIEGNQDIDQEQSEDQKRRMDTISHFM